MFIHCNCMFIAPEINTQIRITQVELNKECIFRSVDRSSESHKGEDSTNCMKTAGDFSSLGLQEQKGALSELKSERLYGDGLSS